MGTTRLKSRRRQDQGSKWVRITMAIFATIGVIDTGSITFEKWGWIGTLACPGGAEGCDKVLNSAWGTLTVGNELTIPLSFLGLISYLAVLVMTILPLLPGLNENKADLSRRTWWSLFYISCGMSVFSLLLVGLMVFKIEAFCFFCFLSAFLSISLLALTILGGGWDEPAEIIFRGILLSLAVLIGGFIWISAVDPNRSPEITLSNRGVPPKIKSTSTPFAIDLAKHLKDSGAVMYTAYWCPHCHDQKEMFGKEAASELNIIECAADGENNQHALCQTKGITGYPSWEIKGKVESGVQTLKDLATSSGYKSSKNF